MHCSLGQTHTVPVDTSRSISLFHPVASPSKARIAGISIVAGVGYLGSMTLLYRTWYNNYPQTSFHFFNDNVGWLQIDKIGHSWTAYMESHYVASMYRWAGIDRRKSAWIGAGAGLFFQSGIEVLDGFSEGWGASVGDVAGNVLGSALFLGQELAWKEQRVWLKFSSHAVSYSNYPDDLQERVQDLYGTSLSERILKDYNGQSYWLSINPASFAHRKGHFPAWLNIAIGYGAEGMLGAEKNIWENENGTITDYTHISRRRQYFLSLDIDLTRIKTRHAWLRTLFGALNTLKIPAPAIELDSNGNWKGHWLYF